MEANTILGIKGFPKSEQKVRIDSKVWEPKKVFDCSKNDGTYDHYFLRIFIIIYRK